MQAPSLYLKLELCRQAFHPSPKTLKFLEENPYLIPELLRWYQLEPFSPNFKPKEIEIVYDGITFIKVSDQKTYFYQVDDPKILRDYKPEYSEYFFDGEIGIFHCGGEVLIDRMQNLEELQLDNLFKKMSVDFG